MNKILGVMLAVGLTIFCLADTQTVGACVSAALERCIGIVIPSLYAMMIMSSLMTETGLISRFPKPIRTFGRIIFGMDGAVFPIFAVSMLAGYPVGSKLLAGEVRKGNIEKKAASIYAGLCYGAGPAFVYGCISSQLYGEREAGTVILVSTISANVLLALVVSFFMREKPKRKPESGCFRFSSEILVKSVSEGARAMLGICSMIGAFAVFSGFLRSVGAVDAIESLCPYIRREYIFAFLDVTAIDNFKAGDYSALPVISGLVSFGGVCVLMQISALTSGELSMGIAAGMRATAAILSGFICRGIMIIFSDRFCVTASTVKICREKSPLPSVMLMIMTLILMRDIYSVTAKKRI